MSDDTTIAEVFTTGSCLICGATVFRPDESYCQHCLDTYPEHLLDTLNDSFDTAIGLRDGTVIRFESASFTGGRSWLHLDLGQHPQPLRNGVRYLMDRGIDVRIEDIMWIAKAPQGS